MFNQVSFTPQIIHNIPTMLAHPYPYPTLHVPKKLKSTAVYNRTPPRHIHKSYRQIHLPSQKKSKPREMKAQKMMRYHRIPMLEMRLFLPLPLMRIPLMAPRRSPRSNINRPQLLLQAQLPSTTHPTTIGIPVILMPIPRVMIIIIIHPSSSGSTTAVQLQRAAHITIIIPLGRRQRQRDLSRRRRPIPSNTPLHGRVVILPGAIVKS